MTASGAAPPSEAAPRRSTYAGILVCSLAVLMQEVLLTRIFSFTIWYHLAYLTISTALLGFGAAGSLLVLFPGIARRAPLRTAALAAAAAGVSLALAMAWLGPNPLRPDLLLAEPGAFALDLFGYYALVTLPFLFAGVAVVVPIATHPSAVNRLYAADLLGAGVGCVAAVAALQFGDGASATLVCAALFVASGAFYAWGTRLAPALAALAVLAALAAPYASGVIEFRPTVTKALGGALAEGPLRSVHSQWSPVNRVDVYGRPGMRGGFWHQLGVSPEHRGPPPPILSIVYDAHNGSDVLRVDGPDSLAFLDHHLLSTPYLFFDAPRVMVIGVGGGIDVLNALHHGATRVTGVELQPITVDLHHTKLARWTGGWMQRPEVELVAAEGRHFVRSHEGVYDVVQLTAVDTFSAQSTGAYVLAESYLYTVEAFGDFLDRLGDDGVLSLAMGDLLYADRSVPTPFSTRLALVAHEALRRAGVADPSAHVALVGQGVPDFSAPKDALVRGGWVQNLLVRKRPFTAGEVADLHAWAEAKGFRVRLAPGDAPGDPTLEAIVDAPPAERARILDEQIFELAPVTDDRPFFFHVLPWRGLVVERRIDWANPGSVTGQIVLLMMLGQSLVLGALLVGLPLLRQRGFALPPREIAGFLLYFLALGVGFMLVEISFVQKYVLVLGYPTYSLSVTIFSLLVFAALGAGLSQRGWARPRGFLLGLLAVTVALVGLEVLVLPWVRDAVLAAPLAGRIAVTVAFQLPLGLALGMYFPTGIELLRRREPRLVPWAWAVNGIGSVVATVLAVMLGMGLGFSGVAGVALAIYATGVLALLSMAAPRAA